MMPNLPSQPGAADPPSMPGRDTAGTGEPAVFKPASHPNRPRPPYRPDTPPCDQIITLLEKVDALERWRASTESDLKEIREIISQVKLLMSLSIGGGGLSVLTLLLTLIVLVTGNK